MQGRLDVVLVPTDFSPGADLALARAAALPLAPGAKIVVLHVLGDPTEQATVHARAALAGVADRLTPPVGVGVVTELVSGEPHVEIIRKARAVEADLIVIGRHGRRRIRDLVIGSTAERTIRYGDTPVLVVNLAPEGPYQRPIIATDLGDCAKRVADLALAVLEPDVRVTLVHAYRVPFEGLQNVPRGGAFDHEHVRRANAALDQLVASLADRGGRWDRVIVRGDPRAALASEIAAREADLVVIGTHGRTGIAHVLVGSIAEWVIAAALCDVLVTRPARFMFEMP